MLSRRWAKPTLPSTKVPEPSGPRWIIVSRMRWSAMASTRRPDRLEKAIPQIPHMSLTITEDGSACRGDSERGPTFVTGAHQDRTAVVRLDGPGVAVENAVDVLTLPLCLDAQRIATSQPPAADQEELANG